MDSRTDPEYPPLCTVRIKRELVSILQESPPGIQVFPEESDLTLVHALIIGPPNTPYEGGFFYFLVRFTPQYPMAPPVVEFMTTGGAGVRFNPNLYKCGRVCLSILGTWQGPKWSPVQTLTSLLISIQSILNEAPYHNEPGFERWEARQGDVERYNDIVRHETIRVAVIGMVNNEFGLNLPPPLQEFMKVKFLELYETYVRIANSNVHLTNCIMEDPYKHNSGVFRWNIIVQKLGNIQKRLVKNTSSTQEAST